MRRLAEDVSGSSEAKVKAAGARYGAVISEGPTVEHIVREAQNQRVDLIVIQTRGLGAFKRALIGSVSQGIVVHPVNIIR